MEDTLFIVNPVAGNGNGLDYISKIKEKMIYKDIKFDIYISENKGSIANYLKENQEKYKNIVGVGGDGTINDIVNNINYEEKHIGIVPLGSGNDFLRNFNYDFDFDKLIENLISNQYEEYDLWEANGRKFLNVFSVGVDGEILKSRNKRKSSNKGKYMIMAIKKLLSYGTKNIIVKIDGKEIKREIYLFTVCNGSYFGSGMKIMPKAKIDDNKLDICIVNKCSKIKILFLFPSIYWGGHLKFKSIVEYYKASDVEIISNERLSLDLDGEIIGETPVRINKAKEKIKMIKYW